MLVRDGDMVFVHLVDVIHHLHCAVTHNGTRIVAIEARMERWPTTMCPGAPAALQALVGTPLDSASAGIRGGGFARSQCTHLLDMVILALAHARRSEPVRVYDVLVQDEAETGQGAQARVYCNDRLVHDWVIAGDRIRTPANLAGHSVFRGFHRWAPQAFDPDALEAAALVGMTLFISAARRWTSESLEDFPLTDIATMKDACFAVMPERVGLAFYLGTNRVEPDHLSFALADEKAQHGLIAWDRDP